MMTEKEKGSKNKEGFLIVFEGIDGSGKSTQAKRTHERLCGKGFPVELLREPTEGTYGRAIREILSSESPRRDPLEELELFIKDRKEDVANNIRPALNAGKVVLLDRYYYSTIAYQGALGIDIDEIRMQNEYFAPKADIVLIFLIPVERGIARIMAERAGGTDTYEREGFLCRVDRIFRSFKDPQICYVEGDRPLSEVSNDVDDIIDGFLFEKGMK